jgi:hypothetical protein
MDCVARLFGLGPKILVSREGLFSILVLGYAP